MTDRQRTFERIKQSAAYATRASRRIPSATGSKPGATGCGIAVMMVWCLPPLTIAVINFVRGPAFTAIFPALLTVPIIAFFAYVIRRNARYSNAPTQAAPAMVVSKHSRGEGKFSSNHITLEFEDGRRHEYRIGPEQEAALVGVGDAGVAFTTLDVFVAFDRVP